MILVCLDLEKAYDNVNMELMWSVLGKLARAVRSMYVNCEACMKVLGGKSSWFKVGQGVYKAGLCDVPMALCVHGPHSDRERSKEGV